MSIIPAKFTVGQTVNEWTVLDNIGQRDKHGQVKILVRCSCGTEKYVTEYTVWTGKSKSCRSCGRSRASTVDYRKRDIDGDLRSSWQHYLDGYIRSTNKRGFEFSLTPEQFKMLCRGDCFYCGENPTNNRNFGGNRTLSGVNGIDRVNPLVGYTEENSVACCKVCNWMKSNLSAEEFIAHIEQIYRKVCG